MTNKKEHVVGSQPQPEIDTGVDAPIKGVRFHRSMVQVSMPRSVRMMRMAPLSSTSIEKKRAFAE